MDTTGAPFNIAFPDVTDPIDDLNSILATMATSIVNGMPVQFASTLAQLNTWGGSGSYPAGQLAILAAADSGLDEGAQFIQSSTDLWYLTGNVHFTNLATFITALGTYTTLRTRPGGTFYDDATTAAGIWTNTTGSYVIINNARQYTRLYTSKSIAGPVQSWTFNHPAGMFSAAPTFIGVNIATGAAGTGKWIARAYAGTATSFRVALWNGDNTALRGGLDVPIQMFVCA